MSEVLSHELPPVLTLDPGDTVVVRTLDSSGHVERQQVPGENRPTMFPSPRGHCLVGPIAVRGARPGQALAVHFDWLRPDDWGFTASGGRDTVLNRMLGTDIGETASLLWEIDGEARTAVTQHGLSVPVAPFLGVVGLAPAEPGEHSTIPPRTRGGGNIDCKELVAGSTLFLPVTVSGGYLFVGDGHGAQGDGEVGGTAIECGMTTSLTLDLLDTAAVDSIHALTPTERICFGFSPDLNQATGDALSAMLTWMQSIFELDRPTVLAFASVAVDLRITQVANQTWGVHAALPHTLVPTRG